VEDAQVGSNSRASSTSLQDFVVVAMPHRKLASPRRTVLLARASCYPFPYRPIITPQAVTSPKPARNAPIYRRKQRYANHDATA